MNNTKILLDLFPLNSVVFPHQKLSLRIFEPRYLKLMETCHGEARPFGICLIRDGKDVGAPAIPFKIGTSVVIKEFTDVSDNLFYIVVKGERRFRIAHVIQEQPHIQAEIEWLDDEIPVFPGDYSILRNVLANIAKDKSEIPEDNNELFGLLGELIATFPGEKQKILELTSEKVVPALTRLLESF
jgi:Lon protease-like protein